MLSKYPLCICTSADVCLDTCMPVDKYMHGHIWMCTWAYVCPCAKAYTTVLTGTEHESLYVSMCAYKCLDFCTFVHSYEHTHTGVHLHF